MKKMPDTFSIDFACLQISPLETAILYSFWDIPPNKIGKHTQVKQFPILTGDMMSATRHVKFFKSPGV